LNFGRFYSIREKKTARHVWIHLARITALRKYTGRKLNAEITTEVCGFFEGAREFHLS
jgi:hypothetical protein